MTRIALDTPSASRRLALRRWLEARGHEVCPSDDPTAELVLADSGDGDDPRTRAIPRTRAGVVGPIDFAGIERVLTDFVAERRQLVLLDPPPPEGLVAHSAPMQELVERIDRLAPVDLPVLVTGESGAGKEVVARELHRRGPRSTEPFVAVNCAAIPEGLFESELFGHERGSFTDASQRRYGHFERAGRGTLFLDEIGELPPTVQAKLLRALQEQRFFRVGGEELVESRARVISATALDLEGDPRFRRDLYHRIAGARLHVPPLRERGEDLPDLCRLVLGRNGHHAVTAIDAGVITRLADCAWPGNVRQLENVLDQAAIFSTGPVLDLDAVEPCLTTGPGAEGNWFAEALRAWVVARRAAGHSPAELREELLERLARLEDAGPSEPDVGSDPKERAT